MCNLPRQASPPPRVGGETLLRTTQLAGKRNPFVQSTAALYDPASQVIKLTSLEWDDFERAQADPASQLHILELLSHEWRHWSDHVGSLWGQRHLIEWYNALNVGKVRDDAHQFWRIVQATQNTSWFGYDQYFHDIHHTPHISRPWRYNYTSGLGFTAQGRMDEGHPIFFVNFRSNDDHFIGRVPLSVRSLLEVRAMETTLLVEGTEAFSGIAEEDVDARLVANSLFGVRAFDYIYNPDMTEYSVAAHVLANSCHLSEAMGTFRIAALMAGLALNLPGCLFPRLRSPGPAYDSRHNAFIARNSFGYAYFLLCFSAPPIDFDVRKKARVKAWLNKACANVGLPSTDEILPETEAEMAGFEQVLVDGPFKPRAIQLLQYGRGLCRRAWLANATELATVQKGAWDAHQFPPMFLGDDTLINNSRFFTDATFANPVAWVDEVWALDSWFDSFLAACFRV
jgi:hypothetical protein